MTYKHLTLVFLPTPSRGSRRLLEQNPETSRASPLYQVSAMRSEEQQRFVIAFSLYSSLLNLPIRRITRSNLAIHLQDRCRNTS
ncbi:hypothetical protein [Funiculus sociatus]|uniref:hypothetical protein n=1 Tax=Funiculus sociatus TaxID=450527 RepID=UPI00329A1F9F